ncbi:hypothetical protein HNY73_022106 [Argiope bruennichi]|uniref:Saposin B-type domain-containing protein n=1 Tax=Argiope bruennichi TaxID=94029 RepID=A0A8T0DZT3_ARGBR|nr:hypothetical protein HNY73_022106 [Argiope bruennichi]
MKYLTFLLLLTLSATAFAGEIQRFFQMFTEVGCAKTLNSMAINEPMLLCGQCVRMMLSVTKVNDPACADNLKLDYTHTEMNRIFQCCISLGWIRIKIEGIMEVLKITNPSMEF